MTVRSFVRRMTPRAKRKAADQVWQLRHGRDRRRTAAADDRLRSVVVGGRETYGRVVDGFTAAGAADRNLGIAVGALETAGAAYFLIPSARIRHTVGVHECHRPAFLAALREQNAATAVFVAQPLLGGRLKNTSLCMDGALREGLESSRVLRVGEIQLGPAGQVLAGTALGCDVEFWQDGAEILAGPRAEAELARVSPQASEDVFGRSLVAPRRNRVADVVPSDEQTPAVLEVRGREIPTFAAFATPTVSDVTFPVDVVYTWVDGEEPAMRRKRAHYKGLGTADILDKEVNASRYTSHDELKYSLRSLQMHADFVRHVYVVTDGQKPDWLDDEADGITVVDHRDIFPADVLPVFNSHAIETRLHHIPGLSDHYLYFNDDVFVGRRVTPEHFFHGSGAMRVPVSPLKIGVGKPHAEETATNSASKNVRRLIRQRFGRITTNNFMHTPLPQQRETLRELEQMFAEDVARTTATRFRSPQDIAMTAPLLYQYALLTGKGCAASFNFRYVNISREDADRRLDDLRRRRRFDFFCLNDVDVPAEERDAVLGRMHAFLEDYFPFPSTFEKKPER
ncbi:sugar phosphotransferase [Streptomyces sp. RKND-216]|nr:sugar phosphotransferase [Streptomyces sp. RKND-216]